MPGYNTFFGHSLNRRMHPGYNALSHILKCHRSQRSAHLLPAVALVVELPAAELDLIDTPSSPVPNTSLPLQPAETPPYRIVSLDLRDDEPQLVDAGSRLSEIYEHALALSLWHCTSFTLTHC
jgi:hypothetical protein